MNFEHDFRGYFPVEGDQYMLGYAKVKLFGKLIVLFKHIPNKNGGSYFIPANINFNTLEGKKYEKCFFLTDVDDMEQLTKWVTEMAKKSMAPISVKEKIEKPEITDDCPF